MTAEEILSQPFEQFKHNFDEDDGMLKAISLIQHVAPKLNMATDRMNEAIRGAESLLEQNNIGVPGHVEFHEEDNDDGDGDLKSEAFDTDGDEAMFGRSSRLIYRRWNGKYRIVLEDWENGVTANRDEVDRCTFEMPLADCPRERKIDAVAYIGALMGNIALTAHSWTEQLNELSDGIESTIKALEAAKRIKMAE